MMMDFEALPSPEDYNYALPDDRIAFEPLKQRDASKLLIYKDGEMRHEVFSHLPDLLPKGSRLFVNETKVVMARLNAVVPEKNKAIEIFCLEAPRSKSVEQVMQSEHSAEFICLVGGARHWKKGSLKMPLRTEQGRCTLQLTMLERLDGFFLVGFDWDAPLSFAHILDAAGKVPLPPYIRRDVRQEDDERYQTIYAKQQGSVAAPTAGLHFTSNVMTALKNKGIHTHALVLHVGGGTFLPLKTTSLKDHVMHSEEVVVHAEVLQSMLTDASARIAAGTTSMRFMESVYWLGVKVLNGDSPTSLGQWDAYTLPQDVPADKALHALLDFVNENVLYARTALMIFPGYQFRMVDALITNFHQPKSTLLMLVAAAIGDDWRRVYEKALQTNYRFLSYGDANLYWITNKS
jgi:S-adenosylmethionine:tRNA ribosyltransferase-isomerase